MGADAKVIDKIRKLLALGTSPNEHEAAAAVAKAQELMQAHDLEMAAVQGDLKADPRSTVGEGDTVIAKAGKPSGWKVSLFEGVARSWDCYVVVREYRFVEGGYEKGQFGSLIGRHADLEMAEYAYSFLVGELERLAQDYGKTRWQEVWDLAAERGITKHEAESLYVVRTGTHPLRAKLSWLRGAAESVIQRLAEDKRARSTTDATMALVVDKKRDIRAYQVWKNYGKTLEEYEAEMDAKRAEWRAAAESAVVVAKPETPSQRRRREEAEARASHKANERWYREQVRISRSTDAAALRAGREAGKQIAVRPGVKSGPATERKAIGE